MTLALDNIYELFEKWGSNVYDEKISQIDHALQTATLAEQSGSNDELVIAALLHDIGHLVHLQNENGKVNILVNDSHEAVGARVLANIFSPDVTAPIALHVEAKRYLCTIEPEYFYSLSLGSVHSLETQGGLMTPDEMQRFENHPSFLAAVALRRWDEGGKITNLKVAPFAYYSELMSKVAR